MGDLTVITNHVPRFIVEGHEVTADERAELDYVDWRAVDAGEESFSGFRYKGTLYDLGEFTRWDNPSSPLGESWDGMQSDTFFSGILVRYCEGFESVIVARYYA